MILQDTGQYQDMCSMSYDTYEKKMIFSPGRGLVKTWTRSRGKEVRRQAVTNTCQRGSLQLRRAKYSTLTDDVCRWAFKTEMGSAVKGWGYPSMLSTGVREDVLA
jgi:hypothetical protein